MDDNKCFFCPVCKSKTRIQIRKDMELKYFPLFCPKCKQETLINENSNKYQWWKSRTQRRRDV